MKIFIDTSVLSDFKLPEVADEIVKRRLGGDEFYLSAITHFQVLWGYSSAGLSAEKYERLLEVTEMGIAPVNRLDSEEAARMKPQRGDLLDRLIAAWVQRMDANIWTPDNESIKSR